MSQELRPCPFHGIAGEIRLYPGMIDPNIKPHVGCSLCITSLHGGKNKKLAAENWNSAWCWKRIDELEKENSNVRTILAYERDKFGKLETDLKKSHAEIVAGLTLANNERWEKILELQRKLAEKSDSNNNGD